MAVEEQDITEWDQALRDTQLRHAVLRHSMAMVAYLDKSNGSSGTTTPSYPSLSFWDSIGVAHSRDLPILVGAATGALGLVVIILLAIIIWHCCTRNTAVDKTYGVENLSSTSSVSRPTPPGIVMSDSVVFHGAKPGQPNEPWAADYGAGVTSVKMTRSLSVPLGQSREGCEMITAVEGCSASQTPPSKAISRAEDYGSRQTVLGPLSLVAPSEPGSGPDFAGCRGSPLPSVGPYLRAMQRSRDGLEGTLDEGSPYDYSARNELALKTRSLPSWGRARQQRPPSTEDDPGDLYAQVHFSKRRKNRMRNDSAAAIAATRSRQPLRTLPFVHDDTDSLVDNEAVVVYDERTAV